MRSKRTSRYRDSHQDDEGSDHEQRPVVAPPKKEENKETLNEDEEFLRFA
jgi:hypothetical protein